MSAPVPRAPVPRAPVPRAPDSAGAGSQAAVLSVGVIGAGRVGAALGAALSRARHRVAAVSGSSTASRERIARLLPTASRTSVERVAQLATDLLVVAVPDDSLRGVIAELARQRAVGAEQVVAHTSGMYGTEVLGPITELGARPLALHPVMTFTGDPTDVDRLTGGITFGVTTVAELRPFATRLVADLGGVVEWIAEHDRPLYHAALAHGANHLITLVNEALDRLRDAGVTHPERALAPLVRSALENALRMGDSALTGPVSRGDAGTVAGHLRRLAEVAPDSVASYRALARRTADRAVAAGRLRAADAVPLLDVLAGPRPEAPVR